MMLSYSSCRTVLLTKDKLIINPSHYISSILVELMGAESDRLRPFCEEVFDPGAGGRAGSEGGPV